MLINEILKRSPFPGSAVQEILYHGTTAKFDKFRRDAQGIYVTPIRSWAEEHYGNNIISLYANVKSVIKLDWSDPAQDRIIDLFYDRDYSALAPILAKWAAQGTNCCQFGGESDSMVLFGDVDIVNAITGNPM